MLRIATLPTGVSPITILSLLALFRFQCASCFIISSRYPSQRPMSACLSESIVRTDQAMLDAIHDFQPTPDATQHVFHGRGGLFEGCEHLLVDWYPPVFVITTFLPVSNENDLPHWQRALEHRWNDLQNEELKHHPLTWVLQDRSVSPTTTTLQTGTVPDPHIVTEGPSRYFVHVLRGRNHGLFLDMAEGRTFVRQHAQGKDVLNLFAYTCSFSVVALQGGANTVVNIDMSQGALKVGQRNHELNGVAEGAKFLGHDIFKSWGKLKKMGPYDIIISDPPSYQKGSFVAKKDYGKIIRRLPSLLNPNGYAILCLNAPELDTQFLKEQVAEEAPELEFVKRIANPETFPVAFPEKALKVLLYQMVAREKVDGRLGEDE